MIYRTRCTRKKIEKKKEKDRKTEGMTKLWSFGESGQAGLERKREASRFWGRKQRGAGVFFFKETERRRSKSKGSFFFMAEGLVFGSYRKRER